MDAIFIIIPTIPFIPNINIPPIAIFIMSFFISAFPSGAACINDTPFIIMIIIAAETINILTTPKTLFIAPTASPPLTLFISFPNASKFKSDLPPVPVPLRSVDEDDDFPEDFCFSKPLITPSSLASNSVPTSLALTVVKQLIELSHTIFSFYSP